MSLKNALFDPGRGGAGRDLGLLLLRLGLAASMLMAHGWGKLERFAAGDTRFADPLGLGAPVTLALAIFAEVVCSLLLALGLAGRVAAAFLLATMAVAFFLHHAADPFGEKELAWVYMIGFAALTLTGPGRYSIDGRSRRR